MKNKWIIILLLSSYSFCCGQNSIPTPSKFYTDSIYSEYLSEYRKHNIYLPENFTEGKSYPIIYATDGSKIKETSAIKNILDSLIGQGIIKPAIYVESFYNNKIADSSSTFGNGKKVYKSYRNYEYVETQYFDGTENNLLSKRFENHMLFFTHEFIKNIEASLKIKVNQEDRIFYGYSNGAGFGVNLLNKHPEIIGHFICFSTLGSNAENLKWDTSLKYPDLYIKHGDQESSFFKEETEIIIDKFKLTDSNYHLEIFDGGHDPKKWKEEFAKSIIEILKR